MNLSVPRNQPLAHALESSPSVCSGPSRTALCGILLVAAVPLLAQAQTIDDGFLVARRTLFTGNLYTHDSWDEYWEGRLKRSNGNLGRVSTQTNIWYADYGVNDRLNLIAAVPFIWTHASPGVLHDMKGLQDITVAAKYNFLEKRLEKHGSLRAFAVVSGTFPLTNYEPDFQPLSIGNQSQRVSGRFTLNYEADRGWFVNGSSAFTWRDSVTLDRPYYYTDGHLFLTDVVDMPDVFDYVVSGGCRKRVRMANVFFSQQRTQGGGEIRRQDMPFISNHINYSRVGATLMYPVPKLENLAFQFAFGYTVDGRNAGQSTTYTTALLYTLHFRGSNTRGTPR